MGWKGFICVTLAHHNRSPSEAKAETEVDVMKGPYILVCSTWLAQLSFLDRPSAHDVGCRCFSGPGSSTSVSNQNIVPQEYSQANPTETKPNQTKQNPNFLNSRSLFHVCQVDNGSDHSC